MLAGTDVHGWSPEETGDLIADVMDSESRGGFRSDALIKQDIARQIWQAEGRLELTSVDKEVACEFIARHHSALPMCNPRGMLYAVAARLRGEVVAVATAGEAAADDAPSAAHRQEVDHPRGVTYSLATERATTYLSLVGKGLRPIARRRGKRPSGARGSTAALPEVDKIVWEAGPAARPPDWALIAEERREGARKAFSHFTNRSDGTRSP